MTQLSRLAHVGLGKESSVGTYTAPTIFIPFEGIDYEDVFTEIKDESFRANDSVLQGMYQGVVQADWSIDVMAYPDLTGHFLRGMIGPDTVTAGASTTLSANSALNATTITVASATGITGTPNPTMIQIGSGAGAEYAQVTNVAGSTLTVTTVIGASVGLTKTHATSDPVVGWTTHTFKQSAVASNKVTYSLTVYDTSSGTPTLGYTGAVFSDVGVKIDPKGAVMLTAKLVTQPGASQSTPTPSYTSLASLLGWQWSMTNAGSSSTRGLTLNLDLKRAVEAIHSSNGLQAPREIFQGAIEVDGTYKAVYENQTDLNLFTNYTQSPTVATLQSPVAAGGGQLVLTMSQSGWFKGKRDFKSGFVAADFSLSGIFNAIDGGSVSAVLRNFVTTAY